jgi:hypothetical protein
MTKKLTIAGLVVAVAASSAFALGAAPGKAACLISSGTLGTPGYNPCTTYNPNSPSIVNQFKISRAQICLFSNYKRLELGLELPAQALRSQLHSDQSL